MDSERTREPVLSEANAAFIQHHVSINIASRDAQHRPSLSRGYGCRVTADRQHVTVFVSEPAAMVLLTDIRQHGVLAAVFSRPSTHETLQLKAVNARIVPLGAGDTALIAGHMDSFCEELMALGYDNTFASAFGRQMLPPFASITFTPSAAFVQTPGPNAGRKLGP
jgi:hypothetical protein